MNRRKLLKTSLFLGCSAAANPLVTPMTFAAAPWDNRLVVIVLRGAMDGLDAVQPYGDKNYAGLRKTLKGGEAGGASDLDGFFALHPKLNGLMPLWKSGELAFAHAVSTPYRDKRSHFDGQDLLENGGSSADGGLTPGKDGWLNRMLSLVPGTTSETALAVGRENPLILQGDAPAASWSPDADLDLSPQAELLLNAIYKNDPLFAEASEMAVSLSEGRDAPDGMKANQAVRAKALAGFAAERLNMDSRIAAFSIGGWDSHIRQASVIGKALGELETAILTLKQGLGANWQKTAVLCMTEFGRTVRENGNRGTDHGTGGAMVLAGGALKGGKVHGQWPGLASADLYRDRDLMPTNDVRRFAGWAMRDLFGLEKAELERTVFPGVEFGNDPKLLA
ncbi:DUF1501 domain-containing protein [Algicella marina]|uniref:DUF1501 domain-containing protein n=2 Tax=Algicella marina TaxID=2683284 RepID=A0A6P1T6W1_9RHOB|nr:DUF1501 domain-containing protein [Algicella marina]